MLVPEISMYRAKDAKGTQRKNDWTGCPSHDVEKLFMVGVPG
jgi:hypothetical protein